MKKIDIVLIINSFNRIKLLKECLEVLSGWVPYSLLKDRIAAVVFDAGSTDGSRQWLKSQCQAFPLELIMAAPEQDSSFAAGLNAGAALAEICFPDLQFLLFYETDNQILNQQPILQALNELQIRTELAGCGFTVKKHNGRPAGVGMPFPSLMHFALGKKVVSFFQLEAVPYRWEAVLGGQFSPVDVVYTSPLLVKMQAWKESGGLDAAMFPFSDCDIDWAKRLKIRGWNLGVIQTDAVIHDNRQTLSDWSLSRDQQFHRGRLRYFKRYRPLSVYVFWPVLYFRHLIEFAAANFFIKDPVRRSRLSTQFFALLKSNPKSYHT